MPVYTRNKCVVYWIRKPEHTNILNEGYIGITTQPNPIQRFKNHKREAFAGSNSKIHRAIRKYGDLLIFQVLVKGTLDYCQELELKLRPSPGIGYNICIGGQQTPLGWKHSEETKEKMRRYKIENPQVFSEESKKKRADALRGRKRPDHVRKATSDYQKSLKPWQRSTAIKEVWLQSVEIRRLILSGVKLAEISRRMDVSIYTLRSIKKLVISGWEPENDQDWLSFKKLFE